MPIGNALHDREQQYVATKDEKGTWRVLDSWHPSIASLEPEDEIPDKSEAVTVLTEGAFLALIKEAARIGVVQHALGSAEAGSEQTTQLRADLEEAREKLRQTQTELEKAKARPTHTEDFDLKEKALDSILKVVGLQDITRLGS